MIPFLSSSKTSSICFSKQSWEGSQKETIPNVILHSYFSKYISYRYGKPFKEKKYARKNTECDPFLSSLKTSSICFSKQSWEGSQKETITNVIPHSYFPKNHFLSRFEYVKIVCQKITECYRIPIFLKDLFHMLH